MILGGTTWHWLVGAGTGLYGVELGGTESYRMVRCGTVWYGVVRGGMDWYGVIWSDTRRIGCPVYPISE